MGFIIDVSFINSEEKSRESVAIYTFRVIEGFLRNGKTDFSLLVSDSFREYFVKKFPKIHIENYPSDSRLISKFPYIKGLYKMIKWKLIMDKLPYDIVYIPFSWSGNALNCRAKKVITIHDLRPMRTVNRAFTQSVWFKMLNIGKLYKRCFRHSYTSHVKNASQIIAISDYVKRDICSEWYDLHLENKVHVIYNGVVLASSQIQPTDVRLSDHYILYVNTLSAYKNIITLIKSFHAISKKIDHKLVIVGKDTTYWRQEICPLIKQYNLSKRIVRLQYCSDEQLKWLYSHADLFVTPSTREGFGYTPIEAAICECPVISTRCESLPDVTCELLNYYDPPESSERLSSLMFSILNQTPDKKRLSDISSCFRAKYNNESQSLKIYNLIAYKELI